MKRTLLALAASALIIVPSAGPIGVHAAQRAARARRSPYGKTSRMPRSPKSRHWQISGRQPTVIPSNSSAPRNRAWAADRYP